MKALILSLSIFVIAGVAGCRTTVKDGPTHVIVDDGYYHDHNNGDFCPPGQAKKGRC